MAEEIERLASVRGGFTYSKKNQLIPSLGHIVNLAVQKTLTDSMQSTHLFRK